MKICRNILIFMMVLGFTGTGFCFDEGKEKDQIKKDFGYVQKEKGEQDEFARYNSYGAESTFDKYKRLFWAYNGHYYLIGFIVLVILKQMYAKKKRKQRARIYR
jgi:hypothetical protein